MVSRSSGKLDMDVEISAEPGDMESLNLHDLSPLTDLLSDEMILHIVKYLDLVDVINLSSTCRRMDAILKDRTVCGSVTVTWNMKVERLVLMKFLRNPDRASVVTSLNLCDMYWIPSGVLKDIAKKMINLRVLNTLGTNISFPHLIEILEALNNLETLSWSWDHKVEWSKTEAFDLKESEGCASSIDQLITSAVARTSCIGKLKTLIVEIPGIKNFSRPNYIAHTGLSHFISMCWNLEALWIVSWPKTEMERRVLEIFSDESFPSNLVLPKLKIFGMRVLDEPRVYSPKLITGVVKNLGQNIENNQLPVTLWFDHPLMNFRGVRDRCLQSWPRLSFDNVVNLSLPLMEGTEMWLERANFEKLRHLKITDGLPRIVNLNGVFDTAKDLQSVVISAFNIKLDWNRFIDEHRNLTAVNLCEDGNFAYPELCLALSRLTGLKKLSLPLFSLIEICNSAILDSYRASLALNVPSSSRSRTAHEYKVDEPLFKRPRVALPRKADVSNCAISGIDLVTASCSKVEEFELGFSTKSRPGIIVVNSLHSISRWRHLKSLTIEGAPIHNGKFLLDICQSCPIEILRLKDLGSRAKCCYTDDLCTALTYLSSLRDFRLEQNYVGSTAKLFNSLQTCTRLQRLLLWSKSNDQPLDTDSCLQMVDMCHRLSVLYILIGGTTKSACETVRIVIEGKYRNLRPGLSVRIRRGLDMYEETASPIIYPSVHYREMVVMQPRVGQIEGMSVLT